MVSWQAFPSLPPRAPPRISLAPQSPFPISRASTLGSNLGSSLVFLVKILSRPSNNVKTSFLENISWLLVQNSKTL